MDHIQESIGLCIQCGAPIYRANEAYDGEEYIETEDGPVHWDCWRAYGWRKKKEAV